MMNEISLWMLILVPAALGALLLVVPTKTRYLRGIVSTIATAFLVYLAFNLWGKNFDLTIPWAGFGIDFQLKYYPLSQFIVAAVAGIYFLISLYSIKYMEEQAGNNQFYGMFLISEAMAIGAVLANNLVLMLFFWEGLLISMFILINLGNPQAYKTAFKAFIIVGLSDLCLMLGIGMVGVEAKTLVMSDIHLNTIGLSGVAFVLLLIGAIGKAGAMPFHTWIPDAANDSPLPFMALFPGALEKLIGIYLVARIALDMFHLTMGMRLLVMTVGAITIIFAVMMALIQKDFKRLLSYHAISQVGYMILGIGTGIPIGIAGGLFHMVNNSIFKSCLFLTGGSIEKQTGTTDLRKLGGLWKQMPVTFGCFLVAALSISGVPPFNGFVSKEMIFDGALLLGTSYRIFLAVAVVGAFFTAASFLKLGHAVFFGKPAPDTKDVVETHWSMAIPMVILALICILFGAWFKIPLTYLIEPSLAGSIGASLKFVHFSFEFGGLFWLTIAILAFAFFNHLIGVKLTGKGVGASEHIHHFPVLKNIYDWAEHRIFDPYVQGKFVGGYVAKGLYYIDRGVDWIYQELAPATANLFSQIRRVHNGLFANYLSWSIGGLLLIVLYLTWFSK